MSEQRLVLGNLTPGQLVQTLSATPAPHSRQVRSAKQHPDRIRLPVLIRLQGLVPIGLMFPRDKAPGVATGAFPVKGFRVRQEKACFFFHKLGKGRKRSCGRTDAYQLPIKKRLSSDYLAAVESKAVRTDLLPL